MLTQVIHETENKFLIKQQSYGVKNSLCFLRLSEIAGNLWMSSAITPSVLSLTFFVSKMASLRSLMKYLRCRNALILILSPDIKLKLKPINSFVQCLFCLSYAESTTASLADRGTYHIRGSSCEGASNLRVKLLGF